MCTVNLTGIQQKLKLFGKSYSEIICFFLMIQFNTTDALFALRNTASCITLVKKGSWKYIMDAEAWMELSLFGVNTHCVSSPSVFPFTKSEQRTGTCIGLSLLRNINHKTINTNTVFLLQCNL